MSNVITNAEGGMRIELIKTVNDSLGKVRLFADLDDKKYVMNCGSLGDVIIGDIYNTEVLDMLLLDDSSFSVKESYEIIQRNLINIFKEESKTLDDIQIHNFILTAKVLLTKEFNESDDVMDQETVSYNEDWYEENMISLLN